MKVLISRPDKIGDVILALHSAKQLKRMLPTAEVYMHVASYTKPLVSAMCFVDGVVVVGEELRPYQFDAVVDLMAKFETAREYVRAGIPVRIGSSARWFRFLYTRCAHVRRSRALQNEAEYNWALVSKLDPVLQHTRLRDVVELGDISGVVTSGRSSPYHVLFPGVSLSAEAWDFERWVELASRMRDRLEGEVLVLLGPAEERLAGMFREACGVEREIEILESDDLLVTLGLLQDATSFVGPSTGITHLASITRTPGVGLYPEDRSMHPARWSPFRSSLKSMYPAREISPAEVVTAVSNPESGPYRRDLISAFVICKNEEENIERCLDSLSWCDEIVVIDSGSTDRTLDICRQFPRVRIIERHWPGHKEQKQFALEQCRFPWILNLDADEELSSELKGRVLHVLEESSAGESVADGYLLCRLVRFMEKWWDSGGWHPELRMRFFRREKAVWGGVNPHEKALVQGDVRKLEGFIYHYTFSSLTELMDTQNRFSLQSARAMYKDGARSNMFKIVFRPLFRFLKFYFVKRGFLEGREGFFAAVTEGVYAFLKYAKLWELEHTSRHKASKTDPDRGASDEESQVRPLPCVNPTGAGKARRILHS